MFGENHKRLEKDGGNRRKREKAGEGQKELRRVRGSHNSMKTLKDRCDRRTLEEAVGRRRRLGRNEGGQRKREKGGEG